MKPFLLTLALAFSASACIRLPHVPPEPRAPQVQRLTDVRVTSSCSGDTDDPWSSDGSAAGVIVSERHVLTAAHVVRCPALPTVRVYLRDGTMFRMVVERDDAMFPRGAGSDIARLEIASAERFGLNVPPPELGLTDGGMTVCLPQGCARTSFYETNFVEIESKPGDSGTGVYDPDGRLLGLVVSTRGGWTRIEPVGAYWLEGT